jgi:hypothetical protein
MADDFELTQEWARALVDAGYLSLEEYLELCRRNGWDSKAPAERPRRRGACSVAGSC